MFLPGIGVLTEVRRFVVGCDLGASAWTPFLCRERAAATTGGCRTWINKFEAATH